ncbi:MAG: glutamate--tRNA ligase [Candidatus Pacearchaeota archaeon]
MKSKIKKEKTKKENWEELIYAYALKNAIEHNGKAISNFVLSPLFQHGLKKDKIKEIFLKIEEIVKKVNSLSEEEQIHEFNKISNKITKINKKEKKEKDILRKIKKKNKKIVTRIAPEPSKFCHIGHALSFLLNYLYAKENKGKCYLRFEDTNPDKESQEYVEAMKEDIINYLGIKPDKITFVSDDMLKLYKYAEELIKKEKAYVCFCPRDKIKNLRKLGVECSCRKKNKRQNLIEWRRMIKGIYKEGEATLRAIGDMQSLNYVMRDPVLFRIVEKEHFKQKNKYAAWPTYDFYNPIEDSLMNITHVLRSNEFEVRAEFHDYLRKILNLKKPEIIQYGRFNVIGAITKGREILELIKSKKYIGWDDPRLVTLKALRRRGIVKETFYELIKQIGLEKKQANIDFNIIAAINRKIIDKKAKRYSFVANPISLKIENKPNIKEIEVKIHPEKKEKRKIKIKENIFISQEDYEKYLEKEVRLMHLYNIRIEKEKAIFTSLENKEELPKINWVSEFVKAKVLMDNAEWVNGYASSDIKKLKKNEIIQFERFGFVRFDNINKNKEYEFWFAHR